MENTIIAIEALFFFVMGAVALAKPSFVTGVFGEPQISADMRNEVRAVYGGFGLAIAIVLLLAIFMVEIRDGVFITVGAALLGMAIGRIISFTIERPASKFPAIFMLLEFLLGGELIYLWWVP